MMEGGKTTMVALAAKEAAVKVGGEGGGRGGGLHNLDDAAIGMIDVIKRNDGADGIKKGQKQRLGHCHVVRMYNMCDCPL